MSGIAPVSGDVVSYPVLTLLLERITILEAENPGSSLYHCLGGYGRTGTFFGALIIKQACEQLSGITRLYFGPEVLMRALRQQRKNGCYSRSALYPILPPAKIHKK